MTESGPQKWYYDLPPFTRLWLTVAVLSSVGFRFGFVDPFLLAFDLDSIWYSFQVRKRT
jgi:hypothetical protein